MRQRLTNNRKNWRRQRRRSSKQRTRPRRSPTPDVSYKVGESDREAEGVKRQWTERGYSIPNRLRICGES